MSQAEHVKSPYESVIFEDGQSNVKRERERTQLTSWGNADISVKALQSSDKYTLGVPTPKITLLTDWLREHSVGVSAGAAVFCGMLLLLMFLALRTGHPKSTPRQPVQAAVSTGALFTR